MRATSALQAATEFGGFDLDTAGGMTATEVREYFEERTFRGMFGAADIPTECGGYTFDACADAVIEALNLKD